MSSKIQLIRELWNMAKEIAMPPAQSEETPQERQLKASIEALKDITELALKIEQVESTIKATTSAIANIEEEVKKQRAISILAILMSALAVLLAVLFK